MKDLKKRLTLAIASAGCSSCVMGGAVDPAPPPLNCEEVSRPEAFYAYTSSQGSNVVVTIYVESQATWESLEVVDLIGAELVSVELGGRVELRVTNPTGKFTIHGTLKGDGSGSQTLTCPVTRNFAFSSSGSTITVSQAAPSRLPLESRQPAEIAVVRREGDLIELEARSQFAGPCNHSWCVTGGEIVSRLANRAMWRLPGEPGVYQVQLALDYGEQGLAFDAVAFEVA